VRTGGQRAYGCPEPARHSPINAAQNRFFSSDSNNFLAQRKNEKNTERP
jgi:hypothetical protein